MTVAGVSISPVAFLIVGEDGVKLIPVTHSSALDKLLDYVPDVIERISKFINKKTEKSSNNEDTDYKMEYTETKDDE